MDTWHVLLANAIRNLQIFTMAGFSVANEGCCGTGKIEVAFLCKYTCTNTSEYVFWDSFHLTERAYRLLVDQILKQNIQNFLWEVILLIFMPQDNLKYIYRVSTLFFVCCKMANIELLVILILFHTSIRDEKGENQILVSVYLLFLLNEVGITLRIL